MYDGDVSIETYSAGAGRDRYVPSMVETGQDNEHCYATPIYNLGKFRLTDEFFLAFATLNLWKEIQIFGCPYRITREDFSIDVSITNV